MLNAKNGLLRLKNGQMDYVRFGGGQTVMVMIPGVGDGLTTVKGLALPFALMYRALARDFTVYMFSRRRDLPEHMTTREMAGDLNEALELLGLTKTAVVGVSQGGMIAQWLAIDHPDKVGRLVLTVTMGRPNDTAREAVGGWVEMAKRGDYKAIMLDTAERSYSERKRRQSRLVYGLLGNIGKPRSFARFFTQAEACLTHDATAQLGRIACPTLVIGGTDDRVLTGEASEELAAAIPGSRLYMYPGLSHGLYEEAPDFLRRTADFCLGRGEKA